jgi:hypothetical protein
MCTGVHYVRVVYAKAVLTNPTWNISPGLAVGGGVTIMYRPSANRSRSCAPFCQLMGSRSPTWRVINICGSCHGAV